MVYDAKRIYGKSRQNLYNQGLKRLENSEISDVNKTLIKSFTNSLFTQGSGDLRASKLMYQLRKMVLMLNVDFNKAIKEQIQDLVAKINAVQNHSEETKGDYRRTLKQFYKWFKDEDKRVYNSNNKTRGEITNFYKTIESIKVGSKIEPIDPSTILTDEDISKVVDVCKSYKEKALLKLLHETGMRSGELLNIKLKDIEMKEESANIIVDGKTGMRKIPIINSIPCLVRWLEIHPHKDNKESYLWLGESPKSMYEPLLHKGSQKLIDRCFEKAGINKKHNLHFFRHSRATLLAPHMTESLLCKYMGWTLGSKQIRRYVHLCNQQVEDAYLKMQGITHKDTENNNKPIKCSCGSINYKYARYCYKCGRPLSIEIVIQDQELQNIETDKTIKLLMEIMQDPVLFKRFQEFKDKLKR